jgi:dipeptide/tripeptide permease
MLPIAAWIIIIVEFCERLCFYALSGTMKIWLQDQGVANAKASSIALSFGTLTYASAFVGGWLATTRLGMFRTILASAAVYVVGTFVAAIAALPGVENVSLYNVAFMTLIGFGGGGIKSNVNVFGADQIDEKMSKDSFFIYFYWTIKMGSFVAHSFLTTIAVSGLPALGVTEEYGTFFVYMVAAGCMLLGLITFAAGARLYKTESVAPAGSEGKGKVSPLSEFCAELVSARRRPQGMMALLGWSLVPLMILLSMIYAFYKKSAALQMLTLIVDVVCVASLLVAHWDNSWLPAGDVSKCLDTTPLIMIGNIFMGFQWGLGNVNFQSEACQLDTRWNKSNPDGYQMSGDFIRLGVPIGILVGAPLLERVVFPLIARRIGRKVPLWSKVVAGISFGMCAQLIAAVIEHARRQAGSTGVPSKCAPLLPDGTHVPASDLSAMVMMLPYLFVGFGEALWAPAMYELAYSSAPPRMKPLLQALNLFAMGAMPQAISASISRASAPLVPNDLDEGNIAVMFLIIAGLGLLGIFLFTAAFWSAPEEVKQIGQEAPANPVGDSESAAEGGTGNAEHGAVAAI